MHSDAESALKMCLQVCAYNADVHVHKSIYHFFYHRTFKKNTNLVKKFKKLFFLNFFLKKCVGAGAQAIAKTGGRLRGPHTIKMCAMCVQVRPKIGAQ